MSRYLSTSCQSDSHDGCPEMTPDRASRCACSCHAAAAKARWDELQRKGCERCGGRTKRYRRFCSMTCAGKTVPKPRKSEAERFWSKVRKDGPTIRPELGPCWEWTAGTFHTGYGAVKVMESGRWVRRGAHRLSYRLTKGEIPQGLVVMHRCDNRKCVRPEHLELGTQTDNVHDRDEKGRAPHGEQHQDAKLTDAQVIEIRARYASGTAGQEQLAAEYGVSPSAIWQVVTGRKWKHLLPPDFVRVDRRANPFLRNGARR